MYPLLAGLRVIDITTIILGPFATQILGDLGAEVIKIETVDGDMNRAVPPQAAPGIARPAGRVRLERDRFTWKQYRFHVSARSAAPPRRVNRTLSL